MDLVAGVKRVGGADGALRQERRAQDFGVVQPAADGPSGWWIASSTIRRSLDVTPHGLRLAELAPASLEQLQ